MNCFRDQDSVLYTHVYATLVRVSVGVKSVNEPTEVVTEWVESLSERVESVRSEVS